MRSSALRLNCSAQVIVSIKIAHTGQYHVRHDVEGDSIHTQNPIIVTAICSNSSVNTTLVWIQLYIV